MNNIQLVNKYGIWAVVTGASSGIGRAFASELAANGFNLVLVARRQPELFQLSSELEHTFGVEARVLALDLSDRSANEQLMMECEALDIGLLVAAAGFGTSGRFIDAELVDELDMVDVNCRAVTEQVHYFARRFARNKKGGIVLLSSIVAFQGVPKSSNYAASKAYIQTLAEGLYYELKPYNVDVLAVAPGPVDSGFAERARLSPGKMETPDIVAKQSMAALGTRITVRPGSLAKLLNFLLTVPRYFRIRIMALVMAGMTKPQLKSGTVGERGTK